MLFLTNRRYDFFGDFTLLHDFSLKNSVINTFYGQAWSSVWGSLFDFSQK